MQNKRITKQIVGVDIGKDSFYACYKIQQADNRVVLKGTKSFDNNPSGMANFNIWCNKRNKTPEIGPIIVMEATGVYYEELAYFLYFKEQIISVQLAQKIKYFAKSCNLKTKTDKVDAKMIAQFGIEKNLTGTDLWSPPSKDFKIIRDLSRTHTNLKQAQTTAKQQLHALNYAYETYPEIIKMKHEQISFYEKQIALIEKKLHKLVESDVKLNSKIKKIQTINGLGFITIIKVISEVNGFLLFKNIGQVISYAGLDVIEKESGKFVGKTKISKKGNARIRSALYMPAMSAIQHNKTLKTFYERVNEGRDKKKPGVVAVMRKLLVLIYTLWKNETEFDLNYEQNKSKKQQSKEICSNS